MRFSWTGVILAPLLMPAIFGTAALAMSGESNPVLAYLVLAALGSIVSYGTTIFLFLPALFLLSVWRSLTAFSVCVLGLVLGAAVYLPLTWLEWSSSGPDSGPPIESFWIFLLRWAADPMAAIFPVAGLVTAAAYWWLGTLRHGRVLPSM